MLDPSSNEGSNRHRHRDHIERLVQYAQYLPPTDRALLCSVYERGLSTTELARVMGTRPRAIRARLQRLLARLDSPTFRYVLQARHNWPPRTRQIAEALFIHGQTQRTTAAKLQTTVHQIRRESDRIRAIAEATFRSNTKP